MANTISSLLVALGLDVSDFKSGLAGAKAESLGFAQQVNGGLAGMGAGLVAGIGAAAVGAGAFLATTVGPASDLNETMSKVQVVFGTSADAVVAFGDKAANSLGMSKNAALAAAGTYGNLFRSMGMAEGTSADMSTSLVGLAGDLASFNNMDPTQVLDALRSGLSGETEPLKKLGININEALIKQKALQNELWDGVGPLDASAKAQAVYALMMEQTSLAQGDFARTSGGLANQQRIMAANFEDIKSKIGTGLLPMLTTLSVMLLGLFNSAEFQAGLAAVTQGIADFAGWVVERLPGVIGAFQGVADWLSNNEGVMVAVLAVIGAAMLVWAVNAAVAGIATLAAMWPVLLVLALIGAAAYLLYEAWTNNWGGIQEKTAAVWAWLEPMLKGLWDWFAVNVPLALDALQQAWEAVWNALKAAWDRFQQVLTPLIEAWQAALSGDWYGFGQKMREYWGEAWKLMGEIVNNAWNFIKDAVGNLIANTIEFFKTTDWGAVGRGIIDGIVFGILNGAGAIADAAKYAAQAALDAAKGFLGISSPSTVFEQQVGAQMSAGLALGWDGGMLQMINGMAGTMSDMVSAAGVGLPGFGGGVDLSRAAIGANVDGMGGPVIVQYVDNAIVSSAREAEIVDRLGPAIEAKLRGLGLI